MAGTVEITQLAHIVYAEVTFGDLTVFLGPQASGKSLVAQAWKLALDAAFVQSRLRLYGYAWDTPEDFLQLYFGRGYERIWQNDTRFAINRSRVTLQSLLTAYKGGTPRERVFYIPAQRVLSLVYGYGWPLPFKGFEVAVPFVLTQYSEEIRRYLDEEFPGEDEVLFPVERRLPKSLREQLSQSVYPGVILKAERALRKRLVLEVQGSRTRLPIPSWTAGQREFTPLLLGLYWLLPLGRSPKRGYEWVVIEEPEMGLHPRAIEGVLQAILHLLHRGYRVILTTHSKTIVECLWLIQQFKEDSSLVEKGPKALAEYLQLPVSPARFIEIAAEPFRKDVRTYFFRRPEREVTVVDISSLDAWDANPDVADWGGLATSTERAHRILARAETNRL